MRNRFGFVFAMVWSAVGLASPCALLGDPGQASRLPNPSGNVSAEWLTVAERTGFRQTSRYDEAVAYCRRVAEAAEWVDYRPFGTSGEGRELPLLIASKDRAFTPDAARTSGKTVVLVQNCIHAGECAGKDASLMLLRDLAVTRTRAGLLDHVILLVIPIFNTDGHERFSPYSRINQNGPEAMGWRVTARNLNLNRDYMKADAVEMRAWLALWNTWDPDLHIDHHATDGGDWQYDVMLAAEAGEAAAPPVARWTEEKLHPQLFSALEADGHVPMTYFWLVDSKDPAKGIQSGSFGPRFSTGYAAIRNRPSLLVESHMLKSYRRRVIAHYDVMLHVLEMLNRDPTSLRQAVREADAATIGIGTAHDPDLRLPLAIGSTDDSVPFTLKGYACRRELSEISGDLRVIYDNTRPVDIDTVWHNASHVTQEVNPPLGYIIPPQWTDVIELLRAHGLQCQRLVEPVTADFQSYRFEEVTFAGRPYEGRLRPRFKTQPLTERRTYRAGSAIVPLDQPGAKVAVHLLEPEAPDSVVSWGFFNAIFEQKEYAEHYVLEALARQMLDADPELREEFVNKIRSDRDFASDRRARLYFFYKRSPYWDDRMNVYPIARLTTPLSAKKEPW